MQESNCSHGDNNSSGNNETDFSRVTQSNTNTFSSMNPSFLQNGHHTDDWLTEKRRQAQQRIEHRRQTVSQTALPELDIMDVDESETPNISSDMNSGTVNSLTSGQDYVHHAICIPSSEVMLNGAMVFSDMKPEYNEVYNFLLYIIEDVCNNVKYNNKYIPSWTSLHKPNLVTLDGGGKGTKPLMIPRFFVQTTKTPYGKHPYILHLIFDSADRIFAECVTKNFMRVYEKNRKTMCAVFEIGVNAVDTKEVEKEVPKPPSKPVEILNVKVPEDVLPQVIEQIKTPLTRVNHDDEDGGTMDVPEDLSNVIFDENLNITGYTTVSKTFVELTEIPKKKRKKKKKNDDDDDVEAEEEEETQQEKNKKKNKENQKNKEDKKITFSKPIGDMDVSNVNELLYMYACLSRSEGTSLSKRKNIARIRNFYYPFDFSYVERFFTVDFASEILMNNYGRLDDVNVRYSARQLIGLVSEDEKLYEDDDVIIEEMDVRTWDMNRFKNFFLIDADPFVSKLVYCLYASRFEKKSSLEMKEILNKPYIQFDKIKNFTTEEMLNTLSESGTTKTIRDITKILGELRESSFTEINEIISDIGSGEELSRVYNRMVRPYQKMSAKYLSVIFGDKVPVQLNQFVTDSHKLMIKYIRDNKKDSSGSIRFMHIRKTKKKVEVDVVEEETSKHVSRLDRSNAPIEYGDLNIKSSVEDTWMPRKMHVDNKDVNVMSNVIITMMNLLKHEFGLPDPYLFPQIEILLNHTQFSSEPRMALNEFLTGTKGSGKSYMQRIKMLCGVAFQLLNDFGSSRNTITETLMSYFKRIFDDMGIGSTNDKHGSNEVNGKLKTLTSMGIDASNVLEMIDENKSNGNSDRKSTKRRTVYWLVDVIASYLIASNQPWFRDKAMRDRFVRYVIDEAPAPTMIESSNIQKFIKKFESESMLPDWMRDHEILSYHMHVCDTMKVTSNNTKGVFFSIVAVRFLEVFGTGGMLTNFGNRMVEQPRLLAESMSIVESIEKAYMHKDPLGVLSDTPHLDYQIKNHGEIGKLHGSEFHVSDLYKIQKSRFCDIQNIFTSFALLYPNYVYQETNMILRHIFEVIVPIDTILKGARSSMAYNDVLHRKQSHLRDTNDPEDCKYNEESQIFENDTCRYINTTTDYAYIGAHFDLMAIGRSSMEEDITGTDQGGRTSTNRKPKHNAMKGQPEPCFPTYMDLSGVEVVDTNYILLANIDIKSMLNDIIATKTTDTTATHLMEVIDEMCRVKVRLEPEDIMDVIPLAEFRKISNMIKNDEMKNAPNIDARQRLKKYIQGFVNGFHSINKKYETVYKLIKDKFKYPEDVPAEYFKTLYTKRTAQDIINNLVENGVIKNKDKVASKHLLNEYFNVIVRMREKSVKSRVRLGFSNNLFNVSDGMPLMKRDGKGDTGNLYVLTKAYNILFGYQDTIKRTASAMSCFTTRPMSMFVPVTSKGTYTIVKLAPESKTEFTLFRHVTKKKTSRESHEVQKSMSEENYETIRRTFLGAIENQYEPSVISESSESSIDENSGMFFSKSDTGKKGRICSVLRHFLELEWVDRGKEFEGMSVLEAKVDVADLKRITGLEIMDANHYFYIIEKFDNLLTNTENFEEIEKYLKYDNSAVGSGTPTNKKDFTQQEVDFEYFNAKKKTVHKRKERDAEIDDDSSPVVEEHAFKTKAVARDMPAKKKKKPTGESVPYKEHIEMEAYYETNRSSNKQVIDVPQLCSDSDQ